MVFMRDGFSATGVRPVLFFLFEVRARQEGMCGQGGRMGAGWGLAGG